MDLLRDILARYLDSSGLSKQGQYAELMRVWQERLGEAAEHTRLDALRKDVAVFVVDNASLLSELNNFRKAELLAALQSGVKGLFIRDIKFRSGTVKLGRSG